MLSLFGCRGGTTVTGLGGKVKTKTQAFATRPDFHELPSDWTIIIMCDF